MHGLTAVMTAVNDEGGQINVARDTDGSEDTIPKTMQKYQARSEPWMLVVDDNCEWLRRINDPYRRLCDLVEALSTASFVGRRMSR